MKTNLSFKNLGILSRIKFKVNVECVTDLDFQREMIIFE